MAAINQLNIGGSLYDINDKRNLYDLLYPVGSVYISSTNTNPSTNFGGTWTLMEKQFKYRSEDATSFFTINSTNVTALSSGTIVWNPSTVNVTLKFTNKVKYAATTNYPLFTFTPGDLGFASSGATYTTLAEGQVLNGTTPVATLLHCRLTPSSGTIEANGCSAAYGATGYSTTVSFDIRIKNAHRLDSFCDKFYWKRTA